MTRPSGCVFCGGWPLTKEHVLGKWVAKYLPKQGIYEMIQTQPDGQVRHVFSRRLDHYQPKIVCGKCNHGWMSTLEAGAERILGQMIRPHLQGEVDLRLTPAQQRVVATWAAKVALLIPYTNPTPHPAIPSHLAQLYRYQRPPRSLAIWLGAHAGRARALHSWDLHRHRWFKQNPRPHEGRGSVVTFYVGHALFAVYVGETNRPYTATSPRLIVEGSLRRIWPPTRAAITWPPTALDHSAYEWLGSHFPL